ELGELRLLHERARLFDRVFARTVDCFFDLLAVLGQLRQWASLSALLFPRLPPVLHGAGGGSRGCSTKTSEPFARQNLGPVSGSGDDVDTHRARGSFDRADGRLDVGAVHVLHLLTGKLPNLFLRDLAHLRLVRLFRTRARLLSGSEPRSLLEEDA